MSIDNAMDRLRAANPAPDKRLLRAEFDDLNVLLSATWQRSTNVQTQPPQETQQPQKPSRKGWLIAAAAFAVVAIVGIGTSLIATNNDTAPASPVAGPVVIVTQGDSRDGGIFYGTFEVTEGADVLQCSNGTFVDELVAPRNLLKTFTCESGPNEGTFIAKFNLTNQSVPGSLVASGPWSVVEGFDDFVGLQGGGDWSIVYSSDGRDAESVETWTGEISYTP